MANAASDASRTPVNAAGGLVRPAANAASATLGTTSSPAGEILIPIDRTSTPTEEILIPVDRASAWHRAAWMSAAAVVLVLPSWVILPQLRFVPSGTSNRLGDYSIAVILACMWLAGLLLAIQAVRWLRLAVSGRAVGFVVGKAGISARLHPMDEWSAAWNQLDVEWPEYLFTLDLSPDEPLPMRECPAIRVAGPRQDKSAERDLPDLAGGKEERAAAEPTDAGDERAARGEGAARGPGPRVDVSLRRFAAWPEERWWPEVERRIRPALFADARWE